VIITLMAIVLLVSTFYVSSPTVPRTIAILLALIGVATSAGLVPVRAPQDFYGGLVLVVVAASALVASAELPGQRGFAFGPGTAPRLFAALLAGLGGAVAVIGVFSEGPKIEKYAIRGPVLVVASILAFAGMIRPFGLVIASFLTFLLSIFGSKEMRLVESIVGAAVMTAFCVGLFTYLLNLPFQLWPRF
jgi:putative tricarboxylic transport membrane protein